MRIRQMKIVLGFCLLCGFVGISQSISAQQEDAIINTYKNAIAADPNDVIAHFNLGLAYYRLEQFKKAQEVLEKCLQLNRNDQASHRRVDGPANQLLGIIYYSYMKDDRRAIAAFRRSLKLLPNDADTYYAMGLASLRLQEYQNAIRAFKAAIENGRIEDAEVYYHMGRARFELGREKESIASYQKALELNPDFQPALEALGLLYHRCKQDDKAIQVLERLVELDPMNFNANYLLGLSYYREKKYSKMVAAYNRAIAVKPDLADAHYNLGMAYYYQTRYDMAIVALKKAVTLNPKDAEAFNLLGQAQTAAVEMHLQQGSLYIAKEQYNDAISEFQKVLQIDAANHKAKALLQDTERKLHEEFTAHLRLADKFYKDGRLEDAYNEYEQALKLDPGSQKARQGMQKTRVQISELLSRKIQKGRSAEKIGDYNTARQHYEAALKLRPGYPKAKQALTTLRSKVEARIKALYNKAEKQAAQNDLNGAVKSYRQVKRLAAVFQNTHWEERALSGLTRVNAKRAELIRKYLTLGKKAYKNKANINAKKAFNRVLALDPQNRTANEYILKMTGSQSRAKVTAEKIKAMYYKGVDLYVKGQIEAAIKAWQEVIELDPDNQDAQINIARAQAKLIAIRKLTGGK